MTDNNNRQGQTLVVPKIRAPGTRYATLKEGSLLIEGPKLYNTLPRPLRNHRGTLDSFKANLDRYLALIPDEPYGYGHMIPTAMTYQNKPSNSLKDWARCMTFPQYSLEEEECSADVLNQANV